MQNDTPPPDRPASHARAGARASGLIAGTLWSMLGIAALGLTRLIYTALVGRTGTPERLAEVNAQISLAFVATFATAAATGAAAAKFIPLTEARYGAGAAVAIRGRLGRWTAVGTVVVCVLLGGLWWIGQRWTDPAGLGGMSAVDLSWTLMLVVAYGAYTFSKSTLYGHRMPGRYARLELATDLGTLTLTVIAVLWLPQVLLTPLIVGYLGFAIAAARSVPRPPAGVVPDLNREVGGFVAYTAVGVVASQGFFQISMVVARATLDGADAGRYAAAMSLVTPAFFLPRALALVFFPTAAEAVGSGDTDRLARETRTLTRLLWVTMLPLFTAAAVLAEPALRLVFGAPYGGDPALPAILLAAVLLYVIAVPSVNALSAHELNRARIPPLASVAGVLLGGAGWLIVGDRWGADGVALGYLLGLTLSAGVPLVAAHRLLGRPHPVDSAEPGTPGGSGVRRLGLAGGLGRGLVVATAVGAVVLAIMNPAWSTRIGVLAAFGAVYLVIYRRDLVGLAGRLPRRGPESPIR